MQQCYHYGLRQLGRAIALEVQYQAMRIGGETRLEWAAFMQR